MSSVLGQEALEAATTLSIVLRRKIAEGGLVSYSHKCKVLDR